MKNPIIKGRNQSYGLIKCSLNSASTKSAISDDILINKNINKNIKYKYKLTENNNKNKENNKIIDLTFIPKKKKKYINIIIDKLSRKIDIKKRLNKKKLIGLYTEYDSKINGNYENNNINNEYIFKKEKDVFIKRKDIKFLKINGRLYQTTNLLNSKERESFNFNNKPSLESSKFINYDIIKEKHSFIEVIESINNSNMNITNKNELMNRIDNNHNNFIEIEFENYITKLNSGEFNIDKQLSERPLLKLKNKYLNKVKLNKSKIIDRGQVKHKKKGGCTNTNRNQKINNFSCNSKKPKSYNNKKNRCKNLSLINISKKKKIHKIILDIINNSNHKSIINNRNEIHNNSHLIKKENNYKTELSTSANSISKFEFHSINK